MTTPHSSSLIETIYATANASKAYLSLCKRAGRILTTPTPDNMTPAERAVIRQWLSHRETRRVNAAAAEPMVNITIRLIPDVACA